MEINIEKMVEDKEMLQLNVVSNSVSQLNCRCNELEERCKKAEARSAELEFELQKKKDHCEVLEAKVEALEGEKFAVEDDLKVLRICSKGLKGKKEVGSEKEREIETIVDLTEDNELVQLLIENKVLECEKKRAEREVDIWKDKYKKLESWTLQLGLERGSDCQEENGKMQDGNRISTEGNSHLDTRLNFLQNQEKVADLGNVVVSSSICPAKEIGDMQLTGTPSNGMWWRNPILDSPAKHGRKVRKLLTFETEESPSKKMAPSTPIAAKSASVNVIDIVDSDDEPNTTQDPVLESQGSGRIYSSTCFAAEKEKRSNNSHARNNEEDSNFGDNVPFVATPKRKRTCNVVSSESESDDDDDVPICKLKRMHIQEVRPDLNSSVTATISGNDEVSGTVVPRRRLLPLRKCVSKSQRDKRSLCRPPKAKHQQSVPTNDDDESEEDLSYSQGDTLSDFIVDDSDVSNCEDVSNGVVDSDSGKSQDLQDTDMDSDSGDVSDGDMDFGKILSKIQRTKTQKMKWEFEADMLAAFGKDPELCMKAVCALYRQQTSEEQVSKGTLYTNQRGFSKFDAHRGSTLAEFLIDGDPHGGLKKSVKELQEYDPKAVELCRTMAIHYSKQLFEIYRNKEDPFFCP